MIHYIFSVHDAKAELFNPAFYFPTQGMAIRAFTEQVNSPDAGMLYRHPEDFSLWILGTFDDSNGHLSTSDDTYPKMIMAANQLRDLAS